MVKCDRVKSNVSAEKIRKMLCPYCNRLLTGSSVKVRPSSLPLIDMQELKIDMDFSKSELRSVRTELGATKQKLIYFTAPAAVIDIAMFNTMMQQINAINEKLERRIDPRELAKEVVKEVLNPLKTDQKLSKSERMKLDAAAKTNLDNLKLIQKQAKNNK